MTEIACVVDAHNALGECCLWCPVTRRLWWICWTNRFRA